MHFHRFTPADTEGLARQIEQTREKLQQAAEGGAMVLAMDLAGELGGMLTTARRELEAERVLLEHLAFARANSSVEAAGWLLLWLATTWQYLDRKNQANELFAEALVLASRQRWETLEPFVLHHWGRCLVECGELERARGCFANALRLRELQQDSRQSSSRRALEAVVTLQAQAGAGGA
jgi:hypothetical protein